MILHDNSLFYIYFGDANQGIDPKLLDSLVSQHEINNNAQLSKIKKIMSLDLLVIPRQIHGSECVNVSHDELKILLTHRSDADALVTSLSYVGLGVYTADCLPIIFYDKVSRVVGICHAGWKSSVKNIAIKTVKKMQDLFNVDVNNLQIFFGPCAKVCCYQVTEEFIENIEQYYLAYPIFELKPVTNYINKNQADQPREINNQEKIIDKEEKKLFFNLSLFNKLQLIKIGIKPESISFIYNLCTMCDKAFCSNRREGKDAKRQLTVVALK